MQIVYIQYKVRIAPLHSHIQNQKYGQQCNQLIINALVTHRLTSKPEIGAISRHTTSNKRYK
jgi:hypothetical protein